MISTTSATLPSARPAFQRVGNSGRSPGLHPPVRLLPGEHRIGDPAGLWCRSKGEDQPRSTNAALTTHHASPSDGRGPDQSLQAREEGPDRPQRASRHWTNRHRPRQSQQRATIPRDLDAWNLSFLLSSRRRTPLLHTSFIAGQIAGAANRCAGERPGLCPVAQDATKSGTSVGLNDAPTRTLSRDSIQPFSVWRPAPRHLTRAHRPVRFGPPQPLLGNPGR